jgi:hypothetical protein
MYIAVMYRILSPIRNIHYTKLVDILSQFQATTLIDMSRRLWGQTLLMCAKPVCAQRNAPLHTCHMASDLRTCRTSGRTHVKRCILIRFHSGLSRLDVFLAGCLAVLSQAFKLLLVLVFKTTPCCRQGLTAGRTLCFFTLPQL